MRYLILFSFFSICTSNFAQEISGDWYGNLSLMGVEQQLGISFEKTENGYICVLLNPSNPKIKIPIDSVSISKSGFYLNQSKIGIVYRGKIYADSLSGVFSQNGMNFPLVLTREKMKPKEVLRPQTPEGPFDYHTEELKISNVSAEIELAGTLTLPSNDGTKYPVVILISGSGPQNRDSEILGHKSFAVIADHLAKQGIGSFRYDERGVGESTGTYAGSDLNDFYSDVDAIVQSLKKKGKVSKLGLAGHSEGGILAPWYASEHKKEIDFVIMLAGPGMPVKDMMHLQREMQYKSMGMSEEGIVNEKNMFLEIDEIVINTEGDEKTRLLTELFTKVAKTKKLSETESEQYIKSQLKVLDGRWYKSFVSITPKDYFKKLKCPVLVIQGGKDLQVPMKENIVEIKQNLKKKGICGKEPIIKTYDNLNHLFQPCETGKVDEYGAIETTIDRRVLFALSDFIKGL